jgi:hypothetical protein
VIFKLVLDANSLSGYVKEQSLKGIIEWFDFWLLQRK